MGKVSLRVERGNLASVEESFQRRFRREDEIATAQAPGNDNRMNSERLLAGGEADERYIDDIYWLTRLS